MRASRLLHQIFRSFGVTGKPARKIVSGLRRGSTTFSKRESVLSCFSAALHFYKTDRRTILFPTAKSKNLGIK
jgi:hypothetical protein